MQRKRENLVKCEFMMYGNEGIDIERDILDRMSSWTDRRSEREDVPTFSLKIRPDSLCYETEFQAFGSFSMQSETWMNIFRENISLLEDWKKSAVWNMRLSMSSNFTEICFRSFL